MVISRISIKNPRRLTATLTAGISALTNEIMLIDLLAGTASLSSYLHQRGVVYLVLLMKEYDLLQILNQRI
jgi:hypothetical protein